MYTIVLAKGVEEFLDNIPKKHARQIVKKNWLVGTRPHISVNGAIKRISTPKTSKKWRISHNFQIVEDVIEIHILRVGKRNDDEVYKNLDNL